MKWIMIISYNKFIIQCYQTSIQTKIHQLGTNDEMFFTIQNNNKNQIDSLSNWISFSATTKVMNERLEPECIWEHVISELVFPRSSSIQFCYSPNLGIYARRPHRPRMCRVSVLRIIYWAVYAMPVSVYTWMYLKRAMFSKSLISHEIGMKERRPVKR